MGRQRQSLPRGAQQGDSRQGQKPKQAVCTGNTEKLSPTESGEQLLPIAAFSLDAFQDLAGSSPEQPGLNPWLTLL